MLFAFTNTKTAAAHSISYPLTIHYKIPHGIASSMPLIPLLNINKDSIKNELLNRKKGQVFNKWLKQEKENLDIVDLRHKIF